MGEILLVAARGNTWGLRVQRDPDGSVFVGVVRARGRGADAIPEGPLVQIREPESLRLAEFLLGPDEQGASAPDQEVERLRAWKAEAIEVMSGLQDLGRALGVPLGRSITAAGSALIAAELKARVGVLEAALREIADESEIRPHVQYRMREIAQAALSSSMAPDPPAFPGVGR